MPQMRVASDVGGTFTDSVAYDPETGRLSVSKVSTTPENRAEGTVTGLRRALAMQHRVGADVAYVGHGMTTATNAVIQRRGARTAFITNEGFRDILLIGRQNRPSLYDLSVVRQEQIVPRDRCYTVRGRMDAAGCEIMPMDEHGLREVAGKLRADGVEAVCRGHAYDALVAFAGCDKTLPGMMMAMVRLNLPSVFMYGGSATPGLRQVFAQGERELRTCAAPKAKRKSWFRRA